VDASGDVGLDTGFVISPLLARRLRPAILIGAGLLLSATGLLMFAQIGPAAGLSTLVVAFVLMNLGGAPLVSLGTDLVVGSAAPEKAGSAAATSETSAEFGFGLGIAVLGSLGTFIYRRQMSGSLPPDLPLELAAPARDSLAGAVAAAEGLAEPAATALLAAARAAFTTGFNIVAGVCAVVIVAVATMAVIRLRHLPPIGRGDQEEVSQPDVVTPEELPAGL
jgi:DHA2 family multidrug resistance protein-like MFS transporter